MHPVFPRVAAVGRMTPSLPSLNCVAMSVGGPRSVVCYVSVDSAWQFQSLLWSGEVQVLHIELSARHKLAIGRLTSLGVVLPKVNHIWLYRMQECSPGILT